MQSVWTPLSDACIVVELKNANEKNIDAELEVALNIRRREENWHERTYQTKFLEDSNIVEVESELGKICISCLLGKMSFRLEPQYKEHSPCGERQRFYVPGRFYLDGKEVRIVFSIGSEKKISSDDLFVKRNFYELLAKNIESDDLLISNLYKKATINMELLFGGRAYYAGLPWFLQFWGRDLFWSIPAILYSGFLGRAKEILTLFSENVVDGKVPNYIYENERNYSSIDSSIMYISAIYDYIAFSGDLSFLEKNLEVMCQIIEYLLSRCDSRGFISHDSKENETWMDTINRRDNAIEIQALFSKALDDFSKLVFITKRPSSKALALACESESVARRQRHIIQKSFYSDGVYADRLVGDQMDFSKRPNALVAILMGLFSKKIESFESEDMFCEKGVMSLSRNSKEYNPAAYHNGQAWSLCTGWLACAEFMLGRTEKGYEILKIMDQLTEDDAVGCIGESWNSNNFEPMGCKLQLWGAALVIRAIDEFMLGIKPFAPKGEISINPKLPYNVNYLKRRINFSGKEVSIAVKKQGDSIRTTIHS
ncbi:MAG: hypothetical protein N3F05_00840 [Candidatus Diapherotrites archaeon]|nr:hypothetical protein [Candidatus Diapherotrites archaeon]